MIGGAGGVMSTLNFVLFTLATWLLPDASPRSLSQKSPFRCFSRIPLPHISLRCLSQDSPRCLPNPFSDDERCGSRAGATHLRN